MFVHYTGARVVPRVKEHKSVQRDHGYRNSFEIFYVKRVNLFLEFFSDHNHVLLANRKFVEDQRVSVCYLIDEGPVLERGLEGVFLRLVVFRHQRGESIFRSSWFFRKQVQKLDVENDPVILDVFLSKFNWFDRRVVCELVDNPLV
jgi:hypothetical protein